MARNLWWKTVRAICSVVLVVVLMAGLVACGEGTETLPPPEEEAPPPTEPVAQLSEVAPPPVIQQLNRSLESYQPQVTILSPTPDQILQDTTVSVKFQVQDLPLFKNPELNMGPHLNVILDNQSHIPVYNVDKSLILEDLSPGTHTLRVFAARPWHESFKNEGAYAQTTFHVFTKTDDNNPVANLPLLTYNHPLGSYGTEPILLDFYLTNAPLHLVAQENPEDEIVDWQIRVTINGESFTLDRWQSVYLNGFKPGKNWVQLEFLDEQGNPVKNAYNNTARLIRYQPGGNDTLSQLMRNELSTEVARSIIDPNYKVQAAPTPAPEVTPTPTPSPTPSPTVEVEPTPTPPLPPDAEEEIPTAESEIPEQIPAPESETPVEEIPTAESEIPKQIPAPEPEIPVEEKSIPETKTGEDSPTVVEPATPDETFPSATELETPEAKPTEKSPTRGFFNRFYQTIRERFQKPQVSPTPSTEQPEELETPSPEPEVLPEETESPPEPQVETEPVTPPVDKTQTFPEEPQAETEPVTPAPETPEEASDIVTEPTKSQPKPKASTPLDKTQTSPEELQVEIEPVTPAPETPEEASDIVTEPTKSQPKPEVSTPLDKTQTSPEETQAETEPVTPAPKTSPQPSEVIPEDKESNPETTQTVPEEGTEKSVTPDESLPPEPPSSEEDTPIPSPTPTIKPVIPDADLPPTLPELIEK
ncbi:hypothetical protein [Coleofasciculus sp.]|uniref:hypothetical protein n=1 Tax=Coleofasciculus sp. TaxID=3100458 RepID=UPI003A3C703D